ncbi:hypothetical protein CNE_BB2p01390 (plasmid) [Cupriavidus necator N-1]|uniref:Uncharacterized protein n=1 Tax=Cupriavidus necator (strain ATCC 43291 / DSM 13513 / CCUG 52238 / LMG 8453 / N-1) TaxID=1042878 RepID=F8GYK9_CUPNN|nr:hypothetical protein [Cupriavidus necator]AEI82950.1 hypothetical protein CNE_BB2p01390 [Cupriavidus necator N-1]MDX6008740.1 hypothetical protein [Cupriavidus necator]
MTSGNVSGLRWGLPGVEDLGSGMKAVYTLESGFDLDSGASGQGGRQFGRQALWAWKTSGTASRLAGSRTRCLTC